MNNIVSPSILVTGGSGLLGNELIEQLLSAGHTVKAIYNKTPLNIPGNVIKVQCDVLDVTALEEAMAGIEEIYHCAGLVSFGAGSEHQLFKINVEGTANVVNAALNAGVKKMVHVSSVAALGRLREEPVTESMQWTKEASNSKYARSKYLGEMEVWRGIAEGLNAVIVNPSLIIGPGDWASGSTEIFKSVFDEFPWYADGTTGFVDVKDVATIMRLLMNADVSAERFIVSAENKSYREVFNMIADSFNKKRPGKKVTPFLAALVWRWELIKSKFTGNTPLVTKETAATALAKASFDDSKLRQSFPDFKYQTLHNTIENTCAALQQKLNIH